MQVYAVSNKCTHLNVSLVGKTPLLQGKVRRARLMTASRLVQACTSSFACISHERYFLLAAGRGQVHRVPGARHSLRPGDWCAACLGPLCHA